MNDEHPALALLDLMWGAIPDAWSTLSHRASGEKLHHVAVRTDDRDAWARWLDEHQYTDCYYRVCPMAAPPDLPLHRGDASLSIAVPCLFADIDVRSPKHPNAPEPEFVRERLLLLNQHVRLSLDVNTGNGYQPCVLLDEPLDPDVAVMLLARWGKQLRNLGLSDDRKGDLASLMRLPGTVNTNGGATTRLEVQGGEQSHVDLDELLPELEPGEMPTAPDGTACATDLEVAEFLDRYKDCDYLRAMQRAIEGIDDTVERQGGARHPSLRMFLWQALSEAMVGAYPARQAVDDGYAYWRQRHIRLDERRPRHELRDLLRWQVPKVAARTDLDVVRARLDDVYGEVTMSAGTATAGDSQSSQHSTSIDDYHLNLPDEFWTARPLLTAIRAWAHSRQRSADAVYACIRARFNVTIPHTLRVDTGIATPIVLNSIVAVVADSGIGKSSAMALAEELAPIAPRVDIYVGPLGSGEGMTEAFYDEVVVQNPQTGKNEKVKKRVRDAALFDLDEGEALTKLGERTGAMLLPELRKAYSGRALGQSNASSVTRRTLTANSYRLVLLVGFQPEVACAVLGNAATGTPQRFVLFNGGDPSIPEHVSSSASLPVLPNPPALIANAPHLMTVAPDVLAEIRAHDLAVQRGVVTVSPLDSQRPANRIKEAAMLALLDGRDKQFNAEDWRLAGMVLDTSDAIRAGVMEREAQVAAEEVRRQGIAMGHRRVASTSIIEQAATAALAKRIVAKVRRGPADGIARGAMRKALTKSGPSRDRFDEALELALTDPRIEEVDARVRPTK